MATTTDRRRSSVRRPSIAADKLGAMTFSSIPKAGGEFRICFIGGGNINFGSDQGPWDHSFRLEHKLGPRLKVVGIVEPNRATAEAVLTRKRGSFVVSAYQDTEIYSSFDEYVEKLNPEKRPHAFIIGSPPAFRGSTTPGKDVELAILKAFPNDTPALFIEKPISTDTVENALTVGRTLVDSKTVVSVGYFLRYLRVVQKMRSIIEDNDLHVMATVARYVCAYPSIRKQAWWMKSRDCGPIVEQGTHFCDLSRYFGGDVEMDSVQAHALEWYEEAGELSKCPVDEENTVEEDDRVPRVTAATWKYKTGAVGSFTHALVLQGDKYSTELEIYADGYQLRLVDPYNAPSLEVRSPLGDEVEHHTFAQDDPYFNQMSAFIDASDNDGNAGTTAVADDDEFEILSDFDDAAKSYALSWAIRVASEKSLKTVRRAPKKAAK
ncbi:putative oxidoreductase C terminal-domain-containing protein [Leucosporidium creatinivorum]|uniref:Putative oxidoreductase C terminal-domain-containing protein n=1 Tax=Leucosporidium creatinivorum TaxID=106004 RepID=A0A1Y2EUT9_9BASI|nr:putative oxidoreductase C terminal-domain-containing protein [Leucosporidium creatinivorum]